MNFYFCVKCSFKVQLVTSYCFCFYPASHVIITNILYQSADTLTLFAVYIVAFMLLLFVLLPSTPCLITSSPCAPHLTSPHLPSSHGISVYSKPVWCTVLPPPPAAPCVTILCPQLTVTVKAVEPLQISRFSCFMPYGNENSHTVLGKTEYH